MGLHKAGEGCRREKFVKRSRRGDGGQGRKKKKKTLLREPLGRSCTDGRGNAGRRSFFQLGETEGGKATLAGSEF